MKSALIFSMIAFVSTSALAAGSATSNADLKVSCRIDKSFDDKSHSIDIESSFPKNGSDDISIAPDGKKALAQAQPGVSVTYIPSMHMIAITQSLGAVMMSAIGDASSPVILQVYPSTGALIEIECKTH
jgi:hypothetical protein